MFLSLVCFIFILSSLHALLPSRCVLAICLMLNLYLKLSILAGWWEGGFLADVCLLNVQTCYYRLPAYLKNLFKTYPVSVSHYMLLTCLILFMCWCYFLRSWHVFCYLLIKSYFYVFSLSCWEAVKYTRSPLRRNTLLLCKSNYYR